MARTLVPDCAGSSRLFQGPDLKLPWHQIAKVGDGRERATLLSFPLVFKPGGNAGGFLQQNPLVAVSQNQVT